MGEHDKSFKSFASIYNNPTGKISPLQLNEDAGLISVENLTSKSIENVEKGPLVSVIMTAYKATELIEIAVNQC